MLGICRQADLDVELEKARKRRPQEAAEAEEKRAAEAARLEEERQREQAAAEAEADPFAAFGLSRREHEPEEPMRDPFANMGDRRDDDDRGGVTRARPVETHRKGSAVRPAPRGHLRGRGREGHALGEVRAPTHERRAPVLRDAPYPSPVSRDRGVRPPSRWFRPVGKFHP